MNKQTAEHEDDLFFKRLRYYRELMVTARAFRSLPEYRELLKAAGTTDKNNSDMDYYHG